MSDWKYVPSLSHPGYGHIEPIADSESELIAQWQAEAIVAEIERLKADLDSCRADLNRSIIDPALDHTRWLAEYRARYETAEALLDRWLHEAVYGPDKELLDDTEAALERRND